MRRRFFRVGGEDDDGMATTLYWLGRVSNKEGRVDASECLHRESLCLLESIHGQGSDDLDIARSLFGLGQALKNKGVFGEAERVPTVEELHPPRSTFCYSSHDIGRWARPLGASFDTRITLTSTYFEVGDLSCTRSYFS